MEIKERKVPSTDGIHALVGKIYLPDGEPKGYFHIVHGMTEYIDRYDRTMTELCKAGYLVFGFDNLGHGKTARTEEELGFIAHRDGWKTLAADVRRFAGTVRAEYGYDLPMILLGHSMGSFIVRCSVMEGRQPDRMIVMGTGGPNPAADAGLAMTALIGAAKGERYRSLFLENMAFGAYNRRFAKENDRAAWLSVDRKNRELYHADPFCTFHFTVSAMGDLVRLCKEANRPGCFEKMKTIPTLLASGGFDPVGSDGEGVKDVFRRLSDAGCPVRMKLYGGYRHEILNDLCHDEVVRDILSFCER